MVAREQATEMQEGSCNELTVREGACNELTVQEGACNELTVQEGACNELTVQEGACNELTVHEGACNELTVQEGACNELTVQRGACNGLTAHEGSCNGPIVQEGACDGFILQDDPCNGLAVREGSCNGLTAQEGSGTAGGAAAESSAFRALEAEEVRRQGHGMVDFIADYLQGIEDRPVCSTVQPGYLRPLLPAHAPEHGEPLEDILSDISSAILPGLTHWQSPRFFAFFSSPTSAAAICADALISALNVVGFSWAAAPAATELEEIVMDWMVDLLGLPDGFHSVKSGRQGGGVIHGTASEALLVALLAARRRALDRVVGHSGSTEEPAAAAAAAGAAVAGSRQGAQEKKLAAEGRLIAHLNEVESRLIRRILSTRNGRQGCCRNAGVTEDERAAVEGGNGGTTGAAGVGVRGESAPTFPWGSVEDRAAQRLVAYVSDQTHACALKACRVAGMPEGNVRVLPTTAASAYALTPRQLLDAVQRDEAAGLIPFFLVLTVSGSCLATERHHVVDYKDWEIPIGRRFRSLKLWMVLRSYGAEGIRAYIRRHVALAESFEEAVRQDERFQLMAPRSFALVCFRLKPPPPRAHSGVVCGGPGEGVVGDGSVDAGREVNMALLEAINSSGQAYLTHTVLSGHYTLRMAIGAVKTEMAHVQAAWRLIQTKASELLEEVKFTVTPGISPDGGV
ncbi:unnamed protein product [Closterium sp. Yama58-4]|nr:unnamed protein product [Closterium sp. Yama58-4]